MFNNRNTFYKVKDLDGYTEYIQSREPNIEKFEEYFEMPVEIEYSNRIDYLIWLWGRIKIGILETFKLI